ncbi:MAG: ribosomal protection-like ABC-F family protein [Rubrobacteraceae bacterium]
MLAQLTNISLSFPDKKVLEDVSLTVYPGDRISLSGENGSGKTTLLRMLTGAMKPDSGEVSLARGLRIGYLEQDLAGLEDDPERSCLDAALEPFRDLIELEDRMGCLAAALGEASGDEQTKLLEELGDAQQRFEAGGGYGFRARSEAALNGLGLPEELWNRAVGELSAGQRMRLALARILLREHGLILLDEPTNHLDVPAREWLEGHLSSTNAAYIVVSHDRRFLDAVASKVAHLDRENLTLYTGNYTAFRRQLQQSEEEGWRRYEKNQKLARKLQRQAQEYRNWSGSKEKEKRGAADKGFVGHRAAKLMKRALAARRRMEEAAENARTEKPFEKDPVKIQFGSSRGRNLLSVENLAVGYEEPLAEGLSFHLEPGNRLAVVGPNGCGKTSLLRTILGEMPPLEGRARLSPSARVGYFDQDNRLVSRGLTALEAVLETGSDETLARTVMGRMGVRRETVNKPSGRLSSGERAKTLLAKLILGGHNLLLLDEPTNHLDIETQDVLLDALADFPGAILLVSHDRHFVDALATEKLDMRAEAHTMNP